MRAAAYILSVSSLKVLKNFEYRKITPFLLAAAGCYLSLRYAPACTQGIKKGILFCAEVLVPSLFLFMALSSYIVKSGLAQTLSKPFSGAARVLFRLPPQSLSVILMSMIGGYPVGARCAAAMAQEGQLRADEAEKTACIAVCAGPGFLLNFVGGALLGNSRAGLLLLTAELIGVLLTGFIIGRAVPVSKTSCDDNSRSYGRGRDHGELLTDAVADACTGAFQMCGMVVICAALTEVIATVSPYEALTDILSAAVEITTGCHRMCGSYPLYLIAFFIGFGGISVHLQIFAGAGNLTIRKGRFFVFRLLQGIITAASAYIYLMIFPVEQSVFRSVDVPMTFGKSATLAGSAALVLSALCFLGSVHQKNIHHQEIRR